jgi:DDE superfamily endonuclease.
MQPTQALFTDYLLVLDSKMSSQNRMTLLFTDQDAAHPPATRLHKNVEVVFLLQNCTSILQPLDQGIIRFFKHYYHKQLARKTNIIIDHITNCFKMQQS